MNNLYIWGGDTRTAWVHLGMYYINLYNWTGGMENCFPTVVESTPKSSVALNINMWDFTFYRIAAEWPKIPQKWLSTSVTHWLIKLEYMAGKHLDQRGATLTPLSFSFSLSFSCFRSFFLPPLLIHVILTTTTAGFVLPKWLSMISV